MFRYRTMNSSTSCKKSIGQELNHPRNMTKGCSPLFTATAQGSCRFFLHPEHSVKSHRFQLSKYSGIRGGHESSRQTDIFLLPFAVGNRLRDCNAHGRYACAHDYERCNQWVWLRMQKIVKVNSQKHDYCLIRES